MLKYFSIECGFCMGKIVKNEKFSRILYFFLQNFPNFLPLFKKFFVNYSIEVLLYGGLYGK